MSTPTITPYRSAQRSGRDDFAHLLRAEWTKFRSVRGWVIAMTGAALLTALALAVLASTANGQHNPAANPTVAIGPGGVAVTDNFNFAHQPLDGNGSITVRVTSLSDADQPGQPLFTPEVSQPWAKAGIMIKASTAPGSAYAAVMVTPGNGVRMQWDYTHDIAGLSGAPSAASPRWLRLTRAGDTVTGYDSADGTHWTQIGTATLAGLPPTVQAGLFAASPQYPLGAQGFANNNNFDQVDTRVTATVDHIGLQGTWPAGTWTASHIGFPTGPGGSVPPASNNAGASSTGVDQGTGCTVQGPHCVIRPGGGRAAPAGTFTESSGRYTLTANGGDIAPYVTNVDPLGVVLKGTLIGLIAVIALGALFITAEYRRGLIRTTFVASPRRGRVLAAKAIVIGSVTFVAGLVGAGIGVPIAERKLHSGGWASSVFPVWSLTSAHGLQIVVGTAALLALAAILALSAGAVLRRSAGAITAAVVLVIVPLILGVVLPQGPAVWILRLTPGAAFGLQEGTPQYHQVLSTCSPYNGCFPLAPWNGFAVACVWAAAALGVAIYVLRRRDA
jgi:regulation of enolase protein 1 (concanavalin A-like superfamily)